MIIKQNYNLMKELLSSKYATTLQISSNSKVQSSSIKRQESILQHLRHKHDIKYHLRLMTEVSKQSNEAINIIKKDVFNLQVTDQFVGKTKKVSIHQHQKMFLKRLEDQHCDIFNQRLELQRFSQPIQFGFKKTKTEPVEGPNSDDLKSYNLPSVQSRVHISFQEQAGVSGRSIEKKTESMQRTKKSQVYSMKNQRKTKLFDNQIKLFATENTKIKRSNTYLFNQGTKKCLKSPRKSKQSSTETIDVSLMKRLNRLAQKSFRNEQNIRIDRDLLSEQLQKVFVNDAVTKYFNFEPVEDYRSIKQMTDYLKKAQFKELLMLTFFTFDINKDGFICQNDLYHLNEGLQTSSKILDDLRTISSFLKANQLRSQHTNLSNTLLKFRNRYQYQEFFQKRAISSKSIETKYKKIKITKQFFTLKKTKKSNFFDELPSISKEHTNKKYQINFDVFTLIFQDKLPYFISELLNFFSDNYEDKSKVTQVSDSIYQKILNNLKDSEQKLRINEETRIYITLFDQSVDQSIDFSEKSDENNKSAQLLIL